MQVDTVKLSSYVSPRHDEQHNVLTLHSETFQILNAMFGANLYLLNLPEIAKRISVAGPRGTACTRRAWRCRPPGPLKQNVMIGCLKVERGLISIYLPFNS